MFARLLLLAALGSISLRAALSPVLVDTSPADGATASELKFIEVIFDVNVTGVDAADLLINNVPASKVSQISPRDYSFEFTEPATGKVVIAWIPNHGITDLATPPSAFAGTGWSFTFDPTEPKPDVVISEFLADNNNGIRDDDGARSDWIELLNQGLVPASLEGWFLTDTTNNLTKWRIPAVTLDINKYLLIWASGKNRQNPGAPLHTSFKLENGGGYLALVDPTTNIVSAFAPAYPAQRSNISYGRDRATASITGYFSVPTPGTANSTNGPGFAPDPVFSPEGGVFTNAFLEITLSSPAGEIRYTRDGSLPGTNSLVYSAAINITNSTVIKARVFQSGLLPSAIIAQPYFMLDPTAAGFRSKLPLMMISTSGRAIAANVSPGTARTFASLAAIDTFRGRSGPFGRPDYFGTCEIEMRGQTSGDFPKKPYNLEVQDPYRVDRNVSFFGLPANSDWALTNPYTDKPFLQNFLAHEIFEKMGHYAVRRQFVEVFVNTANSKITYPRDYAGVYLILEKIKLDDNRVQLTRLTPGDTNEPAITGGYIFKKDKDSTGDRNFSTSGGGGFSGQALKVHEPKPREVTTAQVTWLTKYLNQFEKALYSTNWRAATGTNHYSHYIDADSFVDYHWIVEYAKQIDGYRLSNYMQKDRNGKIKMEPIWDWNLSFGNADYLDGFRTNGWYYSLISDADHIWLRRLITGVSSASGANGDPNFNQKIVDRWSVLRTNIMGESNVLARVDEMAALLTESATRDFQKWPRLGKYVWPNPSFYVTPTNYAGVITSLKNWIRGRTRWIDSQIVQAPALSSLGGRITNGFILALTASTQTVYYTTDGSDPRLPGGAISASAVAYTAPITLTGNARVFARVRNGTRWSGPAAATFVAEDSALAISELMYHPAPPEPGSPYVEDDFEFIEFKNRGSSGLNLDGFEITAGVSFRFPGYVVAPGQRVLVVKNRGAFESRYGTSFSILGEFTGQLDNAGERLTVTGAFQETIIDFVYQPEWHPISDGAGFSLAALDEDSAARDPNASSSWRVSTHVNGSPGLTEEAAPTFPKVVVNEVLNHPVAPATDMIEVQNLSSTPAPIGGWFISDDANTPRKYRIPDGTVIPAGGFMTFSGTVLSDPAKALIPFGLNATGDEVFLFSGDAKTNLTGYRHGFEFGAQKSGVTFGRYTDSTGREQFVTQFQATPGQTNSGPWISPIVITEIMYRPPDVYTNKASWNNTEDEYVEIFNRSGRNFELYDTAFPAHPWTIQGAVDYTFPTNVVLPADSFAILVNFDPVRDPVQAASFRAKYQVPNSAVLFGPYAGGLKNSGGRIRLLMPDTPVAAGPETGAVPYVVAEEIAYTDSAPWPGAADGLGFALSRVNSAAFGNDPANWIGQRPTPGAMNLPYSGALFAGLNSISSEGRTVLQFTALPGTSWVLQSSADLVNWQPVGTASAAANGLLTWEDPGSNSRTARFYRVKPL